jgi:AraC-like DNA-binding protein
VASAVQLGHPMAPQALVEVRASAVNPSDVKNVAGVFKALLPRVPGRDYAGVVAAGEGWTGKAVWGSGAGFGVTSDGADAQYVVVDLDALSEKPAQLSMAEASARSVSFHACHVDLPVLKEQADRSLLRLERDGSLRVQIERIMAEHGPLPLTMENAACELGTSARSLQRRLLAEKLNFAELVTRHRVDVAKRMLERPSASLQATAYDMGFASASAFHRAFKRWTGMTPKQYQDSF